MRLRVSRVFFVLNISLASFGFKRLTRAQVCIDGTAGCFAWPRSRGQPPKPGGSRRKARGVDGESARRATMVPGHYAANVTAFLLILFSRSDYVCSIDPRRSPLRYAATPLHQLISGRNRVRTKVPLASLRGQRAPRGMGPFYKPASFSHVIQRSHIHLGFRRVPFVGV